MLKKYSVRHVSSEAGKFLRYLGPGILITVGFIDPGNWAANIAAGSGFGYSLLWMVTLSTIMLVFLQHNVAHLGIVTGLCLAEAATTYLPLFLSRLLLLTAVAASIATALAEILGAALAISMLTGMPVIPAALLTAAFCFMLLWTNSYKKLERVIIAFVSLIGLSFLMELFLVPLSWTEAVKGSFVPTFPTGSVPVIMSVLGAVVMPHNLFLHSEIIQSRQWNLEDEAIIKRQLNYEFLDTLFSMVIGWAINSAMIIIAAALFFSTRSDVTEIAQAQIMLEPMLGKGAALLFAVALFFAGIASTTTAGMASGTIYAGIFGEAYNIKDYHSWHGVALTYVLAVVVICFITDPFKGLVYSQIVLSVQLPLTVFTQIYLTSAPKVMGAYANTKLQRTILGLIALIVTILNVLLLIDVLF